MQENNTKRVIKPENLSIALKPNGSSFRMALDEIMSSIACQDLTWSALGPLPSPTAT